MDLPLMFSPWICSLHHAKQDIHNIAPENLIIGKLASTFEMVPISGVDIDSFSFSKSFQGIVLLKKPESNEPP